MGGPGPSFPGPSSSPSYLVLLGGGPSQVLPAVLPIWSFLGGGGVPGPSSSPSHLVLGGRGVLDHPSQVLPAVLPIWSFLGGAQALLPRSFLSGPSWGGGPRPSFLGPSHLVLIGGTGVPGPSFPGPSRSPSHLVLLGHSWVSHPMSFQQSFQVGPSGGPKYYGIELDRLTDRQKCHSQLVLLVVGWGWTD